MAVGRFTLISLITVLSGTGCLVDIDFGSGPYKCEAPPQTCDDGFQCLGGMCVPNDAQPDGGVLDSGVDAGFALPVYNPPELITELNAPGFNNDDAAFSADMLYVIINSNRGGQNDFWVSERESVDDEWPQPVREDNLSSTDFDTTIGLSPNGLHVVLGRALEPGNADLYVSSRADRNSPWTVPTILDSINTPREDLAGWISDDGNTIVFDSNRDGADFEIYRSTRAEGDVDFQAPELLSDVNSLFSDAGARLAAQGQVIVFHSDRTGGPGATDIFISIRGSDDVPFPPAVVLEGVVSEGDDLDPWISDDLCTVTLARLNGDGLLETYQATCVR